jgi:hypothetical protein
MRLAFASVLMIAGATTVATPSIADDPVQHGLPLASRFDLAEASMRPAYARSIVARDELSDQFALPELSAPPMPPHQPAKLRIRGKKLKLRLPLG